MLKTGTNNSDRAAILRAVNSGNEVNAKALAKRLRVPVACVQAHIKFLKTPAKKPASKPDPLK
jgi:predicted ArsR family transcriptional regulator